MANDCAQKNGNNKISYQFDANGSSKNRV
jgi:hypothetical protein